MPSIINSRPTPPPVRKQSNFFIFLVVAIVVWIGIILLLISNRENRGPTEPNRTVTHENEPVVNFNDIGDVDPNEATQYNRQGKNHLNRGEHQKAVYEFKKAVKAKSSNPEYWNNLGYAYQLMGYYKVSNYCCIKALELEPNRAVAFGNMAYNFAKLNQVDQAVDYWMKYMEYLNTDRKRSRGINFLRKLLREDKDPRIKNSVRIALTNLRIEY